MASTTDIAISQDFASLLLISAKACKDAKTRVSALVGANKELAKRGPELFHAILEEFHPTTREYFPDRQTEFTSVVQGSGENAISTYERLKYLAFRYGLSRGRPVSDEDLKEQFFMAVGVWLQH